MFSPVTEEKNCCHDLWTQPLYFPSPRGLTEISIKIKRVLNKLILRERWVWEFLYNTVITIVTAKSLSNVTTIPQDYFTMKSKQCTFGAIGCLTTIERPIPSPTPQSGMVWSITVDYDGGGGLHNHAHICKSLHQHCITACSGTDMPATGCWLPWDILVSHTDWLVHMCQLTWTSRVPGITQIQLFPLSCQ